MELIRSIMRNPAAASLLSLIAAVAFYVTVGRADILALGAAASWLNFAANLGIVALPVGLLMIAGEIDISFGAMIPAGAITTALLSGTYGLPIEVGMLGALALGIVVGLINGILATRTRVPSLLITLGTLTVMQGVVLWAAMGLAGNASIPLKSPGLGQIHVWPSDREQPSGHHFVVDCTGSGVWFSPAQDQLWQLGLCAGR